MAIIKDAIKKLNSVFHSTGKKLWIAVAAAVLAIVVAGVSLAAFIGRGDSKGILTGSEHYFTSNVLSDIGNSSMASGISIKCSGTEQYVQIRNYNAGTGECNSFNITYNVYYKLNTALDATDMFRYYINFGGQDIEVLSNDWTMYNTNLVLAGNVCSLNNIITRFIAKDPVNEYMDSANGICIYAVPILPDYMRSSMLGGCVAKNSNSFSVSGVFIQQDTLSNCAGFMYQISSVGATEDGQTVSITYDNEKLQLDPDNALNDITPVVNGTSTTITYPASDTLRFLSLSFYRVDNVFWSAAATDWNAVQSLVTLTYSE